MKNYKWNTEDTCGETHIVLFTSRNKDNAKVKDFKQRRKAFVTTLPKDDPRLLKEFQAFVINGVHFETSRMYYSVNARDNAKVNKALVHYLIDNPDTKISTLQGRIAAIAAQKECAATKHWMFDFDSSDESKVNEFVNDIKKIDDTLEVSIHNTLHNYAIVVNHGFDCRTLLEKWKDIVGLKKDNLLYVTYGINVLV